MATLILQMIYPEQARLEGYNNVKVEFDMTGEETLDSMLSAYVGFLKLLTYSIDELAPTKSSCHECDVREESPCFNCMVLEDKLKDLLEEKIQDLK